ncbi:flagellar motor switch protein FliG [Sporichthya brevicatena]|uniref:Flagellar motor switch protein FliG n=1 Tax=Sporichthya brevicatena TaxID=171442 RepID=A0ABN1GE32_9ACTN
MSTDLATLSGVTKAAILLMQVPRDDSARILAQMRETEVEAVTAEIVRLQHVDPDLADRVITEFQEMAAARRVVLEGGVRYARDLLAGALGEEKADEVIGRISASMKEIPFEFLRRADPRQILSYLADEHPQTIALVLAHMSADQASLVLGGLAPALQADVAHRIAVMDRTSPEIITSVETSLKRRLLSVLATSEFSEVGGISPLVDIISRADRSTEKLILEGLEGRDPDLADEIRSHMFMFKDIVGLDDRSVQLVLRQIDTSTLATALKGVSEDVKEKILKNISERAAENLLEEIDLLGPVRLRTVEEAQASIVQSIRSLEESGELVMRRESDDDFVS